MDKRIQKTRRAIYDAFTTVLNNKPFNKITIEDILVESKVSRSTFYSHYKTKEELLNSILDDMIHHVFSHSLEEEKTHDFSKTNIFDYHHFITHILYHLHDEKTLIQAILNSDCKDAFLNKLRVAVEPISNKVVKEEMVKNLDVPVHIQEKMITESFIILVNYWFVSNCVETPEKITSYFISLNQ